MSDEEVSLHGYEILQKYFTLVAMRQDKAKSYSDAEKEGFIHQNSNRTKKEKDEILNKYSHLINQYSKPSKAVHTPKPIENKFYSNINDFEVTEEIKSLFGDGYDTLEYKKMFDQGSLILPFLFLSFLDGLKNYYVPVFIKNQPNP